MSLFFWIVIGAALGALVLGLFLKVRLAHEQQVWGELVDSGDSSNPVAPQTHGSDASDPNSNFLSEYQDEAEMNTPTFSQSHRSVRDTDLRRSSRVDRSISLIVLGTNRRGEIFQERTSAVSVNLHGCRYSSRHEYSPDGWVTLQVTGTDGMNSRPVRARVRSVFTSPGPRELCQVGVELETPANVWGISTIPEDWQRLISSGAARNGAGASVAQETVPPLSSAPDKQPTPSDKKAEVTMFPGPSASGPGTDDTLDQENPARQDRVVATAEQLLQALQGKLQAAADKAVQASLSVHIDDAVKAALGRIEEGWKANVRQTEEFSAKRIAETQALWEKELHDYRDRAEEVARRIEALTTLAQQALSDSQHFVERFADETVPQLQAQLTDSFSRAHADFQTRIEESSANHLAQLSESAEKTKQDVRSKLEDAVAAATFPTSDSISRADFESGLGSLKTETSDRVEKRLTELQEAIAKAQTPPDNMVTTAAFESRLESLQHESSDRLEKRFSELQESIVKAQAPNENLVTTANFESRFDSLRNEAFDRFEARIAELQDSFAKTPASSIDAVSTTDFSSQINALKAETFDRLEKQAAEIRSGLEQQFEQLRARNNDLTQQLEGIALESRQARAQHEQGLAEVRLLASTSGDGMAQEQLDSVMKSAREQMLNHVEWRLGEVSAHYDQLFGQNMSRANEVSQQLEKLVGETREQLTAARNLVEGAPRGMVTQDHMAIEQSVDTAAREFENAAARVSDRQLVRMMEQKQVVTREASLELEARASETRSLLQKASNSTLEDFRRRVETQAEELVAETKDRVVSSLASLDAESRATVEVRRKSLEADVARAAEQSTMEFRSGIKAFLYSCLVAAVSAVDQHAQTTLVGLNNDPTNARRAIESIAKAAGNSNSTEEAEFPPKAATNSQ
jgi:hypothetical protein